MIKEHDSFKKVDSELSENDLTQIIDIGRPDAEEYSSDEKYMEVFQNIEANVKNKNGGGHAYKQINLTNGIDHTKEYSEVALMLSKSIVHHKKSFNDIIFASS